MGLFLHPPLAAQEAVFFQHGGTGGLGQAFSALCFLQLGLDLWGIALSALHFLLSRNR